jgi:glucose-6-phosphate isomerase
MSVAPLLERPAWKLLQRHYETLRTRHLRDLFAADSKRGEKLCLEAVDITHTRQLDESPDRLLPERKDEG